MTDIPTQETINQWHRRFAVACNNRAWDLTTQSDRTAAENQEMRYTAYAAAYHWQQVGQPINHLRAEITLAHVHALLGEAGQALHYADRCLAFCETNECEDWDLAFAHLEMALAAAVSGDAKSHARHYARARELGEAIQEEEDRRIFLDELARTPAGR
ncbi:MAG: hypothetical protein AB1791_06175 [Chloroflexota bacterium]